MNEKKKGLQMKDDEEKMKVDSGFGDGTLMESYDTEGGVNVPGAGGEYTATEKIGERGQESVQTRTEEERRELTDMARERYDMLSGMEDMKKAEIAAAEARYAMPDREQVQEGLRERMDAELRGKWGDGVVDSGGAGLSGREAREFRRDRRASERGSGVLATQMEMARRRDAVYSMLDPNYEPEADGAREQIIRSLVAGAGDVLSLVGRAGMAAHGGYVMPMGSFSDGVIADLKVERERRRALQGALEKLRMAEIDRPKAELEAIRKEKADLLGNAQSYDRTRTSRTEGMVQEGRREVSGKRVTGKESGAGGQGSGKIGSDELNIPVKFSSENGIAGMTVKANTAQVIPYIEEMFRIYQEASSAGAAENKEINDTWAVLLDLMNKVDAGYTDDMSGFRQKTVNYITKMQNYMRSNRDVPEDIRRKFYDLEDSFMRSIGVSPGAEGTEASVGGMTVEEYFGTSDDGMTAADSSASWFEVM